MVMNCGHTICGDCMENLQKLRQYNCPKCKHPIKDFEIKNFELISAIKYLKYHQEEKIKLQAELDLANAYQKLRVNNVKVV